MHWYLLPMLEWCSANWEPLFHEERPPAGKKEIRSAADVRGIAAAMAYSDVHRESQRHDFEHQFAWQQRHSLRAARDGGIFPDVRFRRFRDQVEISWTSAPLAGGENVQFLATEGTEYADPVTVTEPLYEVVKCAADWLAERLPASAQCNALVEAVRELRSPARHEERTAWVAGLGTDRHEAVSRWRRIRALSASAGRHTAKKAFEAVFDSTRHTEIVLQGSCSAALLFGSANPTIDESDALSLARLLLDEYDRAPVDGLADYVEDEPVDASRAPWQHGYDLAADLLDEIKHEAAGPDIEIVLRNWHVRVAEIALSDPGVRAISFVSANHAPTIALNQTHPSADNQRARRFTLAHELCHLLHDRSFGKRLAIASGPWAPQAVEQRANAFAAWLLMPPDRLNAAIARTSNRVDTREGIRSVARRLNVSQTALVEHLFNMGFIDTQNRLELRSEH